MLGKQSLLYVSFIGIILQGCQCCKTYKDSTIAKYCSELTVDHGSVCYKWHFISWEAHITCVDGFKINYRNNIRKCNRIREKLWKWDDRAVECIYDKTSAPGTTTTPMTTTMLQTITTSSRPTITEITTPSSTTRVTQTTTSTVSVGETSPETVTAEMKTDQSNNGGSFLVVYITVFLVAIFHVGGFCALYYYRRRRYNSITGGRPSKRVSVSTVTNRAYVVDDRESIPDIGAENDNADFIEIPDNVDESNDDRKYSTVTKNDNDRINLGLNRWVRMNIGPNCDDGQYNTLAYGVPLHTGPNGPKQGGRMNMSPNYYHIELPSDTYDHTTNTTRNENNESDTYSHLQGAIQKSRPNLNQSDNIYNELRVNNGEFEKSAGNVQNEDPYDLTDTCFEGPANAVDETYTRVNIHVKLEEDNDEANYANSQECHDYFNLKKIEKQTKN